MEISIRDMKNHLSRYLKLVRTGKDVIITDRGTPIARLMPIPRPAESDAEVLQHLLALPWMQAGNGKKFKGSKEGIALRGAGPTAADIVLQDRE